MALKVFLFESQCSKPRRLTTEKQNWMKPWRRKQQQKSTFYILQLFNRKSWLWKNQPKWSFRNWTKEAAEQAFKNNPDAVLATNFARKDEQQRQINKLKKQEFSKNPKQAENFANKEQLVRPMKSHVNCWKKNTLFLKSNWPKTRRKVARTKIGFRNNRTAKKDENKPEYPKRDLIFGFNKRPRLQRQPPISKRQNDWKSSA